MPGKSHIWFRLRLKIPASIYLKKHFIKDDVFRSILLLIVTIVRTHATWCSCQRTSLRFTHKKVSFAITFGKQDFKIIPPLHSLIEVLLYQRKVLFRGETGIKSVRGWLHNRGGWKISVFSPLKQPIFINTYSNVIYTILTIWLINLFQWNIEVLRVQSKYK